MSKAYLFFNPIAGNGKGEEKAKKLQKHISDEVILCDMTKSETYNEILFSLKPEDYLILCGGDGTLNRFVNFIDGVDFNNEVFYYPCGTGNDFAFDLGHRDTGEPFRITEYIKGLPKVMVNGRTYRFINGIGYGIDGYCCEEGDRQRALNKPNINYTRIAIKGLLFKYKPTKATVTVDGVSHSYKKVWLAPTMNGRCYGGGMIPTPNQKRNGGMLSTMVMHSTGKIRTLIIFPSIFKGEHIKKTKAVDVFEGKTIKVEFDRPTALQVDGEIVLNVTEYTASVE